MNIKLKKNRHFITTLTPKQMSDAGMALVFIFLLLELFLQSGYFYKIAILLLLINLIAPKIFYPFAVLWYGISKVIGACISKLLLTIVFVFIVMPVGLIRRLAGKDPMRINSFKSKVHSVMIRRDHFYTSYDIEKPY
jgi:hypothetical protein